MAACTQKHVSPQVHTHNHTSTHIHVNVYMHEHAVHPCTHTFPWTRTYIYTYTHIFLRTGTHTGMHLPFTHSPIPSCRTERQVRIHQRQSCLQSLITKQAVTVASEQIPTASPALGIYKPKIRLSPSEDKHHLALTPQLARFLLPSAPPRSTAGHPSRRIYQLRSQAAPSISL